LPHVGAFDDKHGVDQVVGGEDVFSHQATREIVTAHAARTVVRIKAHIDSKIVDVWSGQVTPASAPGNFSRQWYIIPIEQGALR
jgi:hypothetical protein